MKAEKWPTGSSLSFDMPRMEARQILSEENLRDWRDSGVTHLELSVDQAALMETDFADRPERYGDTCRNLGLVPWSLHLPFPAGVDISLPGEAGRSSVLLDKEMIRRAARAGIGLCVVHPSSEPISDEERSARMAASKTALRELTEYSGELGLRLAVEDLPRFCLGRDSGEMLELLDASPELMVCFDTNHMLLEDNETVIRRIGRRIITLHVSDYDFTDERHALPGKGKNDWKRILTALEDAGYEGPFLYEVGGRDETVTHSDFRRNHMALCAL